MIAIAWASLLLISVAMIEIFKSKSVFALLFAIKLVVLAASLLLLGTIAMTQKSELSTLLIGSSLLAAALISIGCAIAHQHCANKSDIENLDEEEK